MAVSSLLALPLFRLPLNIAPVVVVENENIVDLAHT
jgi:hypothetical protein